MTGGTRIIFLSTDGGRLGALGADHFLRHSSYRRDVVAVVNLDAIAGTGSPRLEFAGDLSPFARPGARRTAAARLEEQTRHAPADRAGLPS